MVGSSSILIHTSRVSWSAGLFAGGMLGWQWGEFLVGVLVLLLVCFIEYGTQCSRILQPLLGCVDSALMTIMLGFPAVCCLSGSVLFPATVFLQFHGALVAVVVPDLVGSRSC